MVVGVEGGASVKGHVARGDLVRGVVGRSGGGKLGIRGWEEGLWEEVGDVDGVRVGFCVEGREVMGRCASINHLVSAGL